MANKHACHFKHSLAVGLPEEVLASICFEALVFEKSGRSSACKHYFKHACPSPDFYETFLFFIKGERPLTAIESAEMSRQAACKHACKQSDFKRLETTVLAGASASKWGACKQCLKHACENGLDCHHYSTVRRIRYRY